MIKQKISFAVQNVANSRVGDKLVVAFVPLIPMLSHKTSIMAALQLPVMIDDGEQSVFIFQLIQNFLRRRLNFGRFDAVQRNFVSSPKIRSERSQIQFRRKRNETRDFLRRSTAGDRMLKALKKGIKSFFCKTTAQSAKKGIKSF